MTCRPVPSNPTQYRMRISFMIYFVAFGCHIDRFDQSNLQQLTEGTYLWSLWSYLVRHTRATCQHSEFQDIQKQGQCSMAFLGLSLRYVFRSFIKWRFTSKMECGTNSWIPFLWMNDLHIVTRLCKQITRFHVFGTKGPMVLDWGVASVCGSPRSVQAVPMKKWLQHQSAWIEWQALFQTLLSKYELGPSLPRQSSLCILLCAFTVDRTNRIKAVSSGMLFDRNAPTDPLKSPLAGRSARKYCWLIGLNNWLIWIFNMLVKHNLNADCGQSTGPICILWGEICFGQVFTYSKFVHHLK